jgi:hypothetical protein
MGLLEDMCANNRIAKKTAEPSGLFQKRQVRAKEMARLDGHDNFVA